MKLKTVTIKNFRLLQDVIVQIDDETTLIVGKNNTGKTSFSLLFNIFMNERKKPSFDDFPLNTHETFITLYNIFCGITEENKEDIIEKIRKGIPKISLLLELEFDENDSWASIKPFTTELSDTNIIKILFEYLPENSEKFMQIIHDEVKNNHTNNIIEQVKLEAERLI